MVLVLGYGFVFVFGTILGSFLNALSYRFNTGRTLGGRSSCMHCGASIAAYDLIPLFSYALLSGRCRTCRARLSPQYPLVEALAGVLAVLCYIRFGENSLSFTLALMAWLILLFIATYDMRHKIIPDSATVLLGVIGLSAQAWSAGGVPPLPVLFAGPLLALPLLALSFFSRGRAMGWGDGKLMLALGWFLGPQSGFTALLFSFWIGTVISLLLLIPLSYRGGRLTMKSEIPYAPFLIMGAAAAYFTEAPQLLWSVLFL